MRVESGFLPVIFVSARHVFLMSLCKASCLQVILMSLCKDSSLHVFLTSLRKASPLHVFLISLCKMCRFCSAILVSGASAWHTKCGTKISTLQINLFCLTRVLQLGMGTMERNLLSKLTTTHLLQGDDQASEEKERKAKVFASSHCAKLILEN